MTYPAFMSKYFLVFFHFKFAIMLKLEENVSLYGKYVNKIMIHFYE